jgi:death on curing protein
LRHYRVTLEEALAAHELVLRRYGGYPGVRDYGAIESALARPYCGYYRPIAKKAAALVHSLALNHGFLDGNKRTAVHMLAVLLINSGYTLRFGDLRRANAEVEEMVLAIVEHKMSFDDVVIWMKERLTKLP